MAFQEAVSRLTVETVYRTQGDQAAEAAARQLEGAQAKLVDTSGRLTTATGQQEQALRRLAAANDNVSRTFSAANDNAKDVSKSILEVGSEVVSATGHLKALALAAYAMSPAFRAFANAGVLEALRLLGPAALSAGSAIVSAISPALQFLTRLTIPITLAVAGFKTLIAAIQTGSGLLDKYGIEGQRSMFGSGVEDALEKLTKGQNETTSPEQIRWASELSARLDQARYSIGEVLKTQIDLNGAGLAFQNVWVVVNEMAAKTLVSLSQMPDHFAKMGNASWIKTLNDWMDRQGWNASPESMGIGVAAPEAATASAEEAMRRARGELAARMGGGFVGRYNQAIMDLANPPKEAKEAVAATASEFERLEHSLQRQAAAMEAESKAVGASVGEHARLRTEMRLQEAAMQDIAKNGGAMEDYEERIKKISDRMGQATQKAAELRLQNDVSFERSQIGRTDSEAGIASRLRAVYGDDYVGQMNGALAAQMRINDQLRTGKELATEFASGFARDMMNGVNAMQALGNALNRFAQRLMDMAINNLVSKAMGGLFGGGGGFSLPNIFGSANGNVFLGGSIVAFAGGGVVDRPTFFPMANGTGLMGEAGPEAIMPLKRGADGKLGVASAGGGAPVYQDNRQFIIDARGATPDAVKMLNAKIDALRADTPKLALGAVSRARTLRPGAVA